MTAPASLELQEPDRPYPGLRPYDRHESVLFFGRREHVETILEKLSSHRFLMLLGVSGCGKSSLARAGLIPALELGQLRSAGDRWRAATMRPGRSPVRNLADALLAPGILGDDGPLEQEARVTESNGLVAPLVLSTLFRGPRGLMDVLSKPLSPGAGPALPEGQNLLLLVDQFEEILRFRREGDERDRSEADAFIALLLESSGQRRVPIYVILTMRSDYLADCAVFRNLTESINESQFWTPRLTRKQRRAAIEGPARVFGGRVEESVVNDLLNDTGNDVDQLPLMQHALMRMWSIATSDPTTVGAAGDRPVVLTPEAYKRIGRIDSALSSHAEEIYAAMDPTRQATAEALFRCLTEPSEGKLDTKRRCRLDEVVEVARVPLEQVAEVIEEFRGPDSNFIMPSRPTPLRPDTLLEISHECLIRKWDRLKGWVERELEVVEYGRHVAQTARYWQNGKAELWRKSQLDDALSWWSRAKDSPQWAARYKINVDLIDDFLREGEAMRRKAVFRILSLDGGGIRSAFTASILATLEEVTGKRIVEHFDLITGTDMGGVIAIALGMGVSAQEVSNFFHLYGPRIFGPRGFLADLLRPFRQFFGPKYSPAGLREALTSLLGDKTLGDSRCRLVIPAYDIILGTVHKFKTSHQVGFRSDGAISAVEIALAATAGLTYFPPHTIPGVGTFIDGMVWAICPVLTGLFEAIDVLNRDPADIRLLSLSTTSYRRKSRRRPADGLLEWLPIFLDALILGQEEAAVTGAKSLLSGGLFYRIDYAAPSGAFAWDDSARVEELVALGRHVALKEEYLEVVSRSFLAEKTSEQFQPEPATYP
jgi:hypothetical protein